MKIKPTESSKLISEHCLHLLYKAVRTEEESELEVIEEEKNSKPSSGFKNKMMSVRSKMITSSTLVKG